MPCTTASPSPVPRPAGLVVKNGSKMFGGTSAKNPHPVVAHRQANGVGPRPQIGIVHKVIAMDLDVAGLQAQRPAARHRITRVHRQVEQDLIPAARRHSNARCRGSSLLLSTTPSPTMR